MGNATEATVALFTYTVYKQVLFTPNTWLLHLFILQHWLGDLNQAASGYHVSAVDYDTYGVYPNIMGRIDQARQGTRLVAAIGPFADEDCAILTAASTVFQLVTLTQLCDKRDVYTSGLYPYMLSTASHRGRSYESFFAFCQWFNITAVGYLTDTGDVSDSRQASIVDAAAAFGMVVDGTVKYARGEYLATEAAVMNLDARLLYVDGDITAGNAESPEFDMLHAISQSGYQLLFGVTYVANKELADATSDDHWLLMTPMQAVVNTSFVDTFWDDVRTAVFAEGSYLKMVNDSFWPYRAAPCIPFGPGRCLEDLTTFLDPSNTNDASFNSFVALMKQHGASHASLLVIMMTLCQVMYELIKGELEQNGQLNPVDLVTRAHTLHVETVSGPFVLHPEGDRVSEFQVQLLANHEPNQRQAPAFFTSLAEIVPGIYYKFVNGETQLPTYMPPLTPDAPVVSNTSSDSATVLWHVDRNSLRQAAFSTVRVEVSTEEEWKLLAVSNELDGSVLASDLTVDTQYQVRIQIMTESGTSSHSEVRTFRTPPASCYIDSCGDYAHCTVSGVCECSAMYAQPIEPIALTRTCKLVFTPCLMDPCVGIYATCNTISGVCECVTGTELAPEPDAVPEEWRQCALSVASTDQTRRFWTLSLWFSSWGLLASLWVAWEFLYNSQLQHPNTVMQAFIAFAVPDLSLSLMNSVVYIESLVDGNPLGSPTGAGGRSELGCLVVGFIMYTIVICTYCAPPIVGLFTFLKFNAVVRGRPAFVVSSAKVYCLCLLLPATSGAALAASAVLSTAADGASLLGSYRGLYCYIRQWAYGFSGLTLLLMFAFTATSTLCFYACTALQISAMLKTSSSQQSSNAVRAVMQRGLFLTLTFVATWMWFIVSGALAYSSNTININIDMLGAVVINAQPIIDAFILLTIPSIRKQYVARWGKPFGMCMESMACVSAAAASSSSSSGSSGFFRSSTTSSSTSTSLEV